MKNAQLNRGFLAAIDNKTKDEILAAIAEHYGISTQDALGVVTDDEAEHLLDYLVEPMRSAVSVLMQRRGLVV